MVLLDLLRDVLTAGPAASGIADDDALLLFRKDCTDLVRRIALLTHLLEEIREFDGAGGLSPLLDASTSSSASSSWLSDLVVALRATKHLLLLAGNFRSSSSSVSSISYLCSFFKKHLFGCSESCYSNIKLKFGNLGM